MQQNLEMTIGHRFYLQALRELVTDEDIYLFNEDLIKLFSINSWNNQIRVKNSTCDILIILDERTVHFTNYNLADNNRFLEIMTKYLQPVDKAFYVYFTEPDEVPGKKEGQKPERLSSQPSTLFGKSRRESLPHFSGGGSAFPHKPMKQPSDPLFQHSGESITSAYDTYDIGTIMHRYSKKVSMLHALIDQEANDFFKRFPDKELTKPELSCLKKARKYRAELQKCKTEAQRLKPKKESGSLIRAQGSSLRLSNPELGMFGSPPRTPSPRNRTPSPPQRKSVSDQVTRIAEIEENIRLNAIMFVVSTALELQEENPNYVLEVFESFGDRKQVAARMFGTGELNKLILPQNKKLADNVMELTANCFGKNIGLGHAAERSRWFELIFSYIVAFKCIPEFFSESDVLGKLLLGISDIDRDKFVAVVENQQLLAVLREKIFYRLAQKKDLLLAKLLVKKDFDGLTKLLCGNSLKNDDNETHFFFSLLKIGDKKIDFALLAEPKFIHFIQNQKTALGCFMQAQLYERIKSHFELRNLPENSVDEGMSPLAAAGLFTKDLATLRASTAYKFLSDTEITDVFMNKELLAKKHGAEEEWLGIHEKNLCLLLSKFLPHLPKYLKEIAVLHRQYSDQVIGKLTNNNRKVKYDPKIHNLENFPREMAAYIKSDSAELHKFRCNVAALEEVYPKLCALEDGTVRMDKNQQSGFTPATCVADKILVALKATGKVTKFTRNTLGQRISIHMMQYVQETYGDTGRPENICTGATVKNIHDCQILWLKVDLADALVEKFKQALEALRNTVDDSFPDNAFADALKSALDDFCNEHIQMPRNEVPVARKLSLGSYN